MALLIAPILFIGAVLYIAYPLLQEEKEGAAAADEQSTRDKVLQDKEEIIEVLRDIDMDFRMGKLSAQDYDLLKSDFENRAVGVFRELQSLQKKSGKARKNRS